MGEDDGADRGAPRSMLIRELGRLTREARDLDLGARSCPTKHIRDVRSGLAAFAQEHVGGSKPLLIDGALDGWRAYGRRRRRSDDDDDDDDDDDNDDDDDDDDDDDGAWTPKSLLRREGDTLVTLSVTPDGRADAVRPVVLEGGGGGGGGEGEGEGEGEDQQQQQQQRGPPPPRELFLLPHEERVPLKTFLLPCGGLAHGSGAAAGPQVRYLSSQNGCLEAELPGLLPDLLDPAEEEQEEEDGDAPTTSDDDENEDGGDDDGGSRGDARRRRRQRRAAAGGPAWARRALCGGRPAEAVNIWIGCSRSETSVHRDPYENVFAVLRGSKTFTLLPPHEGFRLGLEPFAVARWEPAGAGEGSGRDEGAGGGGLVARLETPWREVLWTALDPSLAGRGEDREGEEATAALRAARLEQQQQQQQRRYPLFFGRGGGAPGGGITTQPRLPPPIEVTVRAGQLLYLPAFWWHHVRQRGPRGGGGAGREDGGGCCVGINWWFEPRFGSAYALTRFAERLAARAGLLRPLEDDEDEEEDDEEEEEEA